MLTAERLREVLDFDAAKGCFVWKQPSGRRTKVGQVAGSHGAVRIDGARHSIRNVAYLWLHGVLPADSAEQAACSVHALPGEEWRPVDGFERLYLVSNLGRVQSLQRIRTQKNGAVRIFPGKLLKPKISVCTGYLDVVLQSAEHGSMVYATVHSLVADAFLSSRPDGAEVRHIDGSRDNCAASNLEWGEHIDNMRDQYRHGTRIASEWHPLSVLTVEIVQWIRESAQTGAAIARSLGVSISTVCRARKGKTYAALTRSDMAGLVPR